MVDANQYHVSRLHGLTQPPSSSAIAVLEQLNILEGYDLKTLGHNSPQYLHLIGEVIRLAAADRNQRSRTQLT